MFNVMCGEMMNRLVLIITLSLLSCACTDLGSLASKHWSFPNSNDTTEAVAFTVVGNDIEFTDKYKRIWEISKIDNADAIFNDIAKSKSRTNRLYALMGLKITKSDSYNHLYQKLLLDNTKTQYASGDYLGELKTTDIAQVINGTKLENPFIWD